MKLTKQQTRGFHHSYSYWDESIEDMVEFQEVERTFISKERWCSVFEVIVVSNRDHKHYKYRYAEGATESQEDKDYNPDELELDEVEPVKEMVEIIRWKTKT